MTDLQGNSITQPKLWSELAYMYVTQHIHVMICGEFSVCLSRYCGDAWSSRLGTAGIGESVLTILTRMSYDRIQHTPFDYDSLFLTMLTSTAGTGGSRLFNFLTHTFMREKKSWELATSKRPRLA